jgi:hypothetical protein
MQTTFSIYKHLILSESIGKNKTEKEPTVVDSLKFNDNSIL